MFTGIIEAVGFVQEVIAEGTNYHIKVKSSISEGLKVDQSVCHDGVCLTVTKVEDGCHWVTAIEETLKKSSFKNIEAGSCLNLERSMKADGRFDGHIVQGHVDTTAKTEEIRQQEGSWLFTFSFKSEDGFVIEKGSICVNGISLTCFNVSQDKFTVAIIPYTYSNTNLKSLKIGNFVNLEFDVLGKYIKAMYNQQL